MKLFTSKNTSLSILGLSIFVFLFMGCPKKEDSALKVPEPQDKLVTVDTKSYTVGDVLTAFQEEVGFKAILESQIIEQSQNEHLQNTSVEELIKKSGRTVAFEDYYAQKSREAGLDQLEDFKSYIDDIVKAELYQKMIVEDVLKKINISEEQLRQYYELNKEKYKNPYSDRVTVSGIYVLTDDKTPEDAWAKIQEAEVKIKQGEPFEEVAKIYSEAPPEMRGMSNEINIDEFNNIQIPRTLLQLDDGDVSEVIPSGNKLFLYKRLSYDPPKYAPLESKTTKHSVLDLYTNEFHDRESALLFLELNEKHQPSLFPEWLADPQPEQMDANIISLPGVYDMTLRDFLEAAKSQQINTYKDQVNYLQLLSQKSVMAAEALERGWGESTVQSILDYYKNKWLTKEYILSLINDQLPKEQDIELSYAKNLNHEKIQVPTKYELYYLFFPAVVSMEQTPFETEQNLLAAKQKAEQAYQDFQDGTGFEELVKKYSHDEYHLKSGGRLGLLSLGALDSLRSSKLSNLELTEGYLSEPQEFYHHNTMRYGYEIYFVKSIIPSHPMPYPEAREYIMNAAKDTLYQKKYSQLFQEWEKEHTIQFHSLTMHSVKEYLIEIASRPDIRQVEIYRFTEPKTAGNTEQEGLSTQ